MEFRPIRDMELLESGSKVDAYCSVVEDISLDDDILIDVVLHIESELYFFH